MYPFRLNKTIQAAACLLRHELNGEMNYMRLLKILYLADRESIRLTGRPITGDCAVAMKRGPVLIELFNLIKGTHPRSQEWKQYIKKVEYRVWLIDDPAPLT